MSDIIVRYFHFIGIIVMSAALVAEHLLLKNRLSGDEIRRLAIVDIVFAAAATVVLVAGLALWLWVGKPAEFYTRNGIFHAKLTLFILMALISLYPTAYFLRTGAPALSCWRCPRVS